MMNSSGTFLMSGDHKNNSLFPPSYFTNAIFCFNLYKLTFFVFVQSIISHNLKILLYELLPWKHSYLIFRSKTRNICVVSMINEK